MSVHSSLKSPVTTTVSSSVYVVLLNGSKVPAIQYSTVFINEAGLTEIVDGSIYYTDAQGDVITDVVEFTINQEVDIYWFTADGLPSIYWQSGFYYNADGSPYTGDVSVYQPSTVTNILPNVVRRSVYIKVGDFYYSADEVRNGDVITYQIDNVTVSLQSDWKVYTTLPAAIYQDFHSKVTANITQDIPRQYPISGFTVAWVVPFPTKRNPGISSIIIGGLERTSSGDYSLNSEAELGQVVPPAVTATGLGVAEVVYRQRVSPIVLEGKPVAV